MNSIAEISEQAQVSNWPMRILLTALTLIVIGILFALIVRSWRRRAKSQSGLGSLPAVSAEVAEELESGELATTEMRYVGTASDVNWNDKIAFAGLSNRGFAEVGVHAQGVVIDRGVAGVLFIPRDSIVGVGLAKGVAGRAFGKDGVVAIRWVHADFTLDTGLRSSSSIERQKIVTEIEKIAAGGASFTSAAVASATNATSQGAEN